VCVFVLCLPVDPLVGMQKTKIKVFAFVQIAHKSKRSRPKMGVAFFFVTQGGGGERWAWS